MSFFSLSESFDRCGERGEGGVGGGEGGGGKKQYGEYLYKGEIGHCFYLDQRILNSVSCKDTDRNYTFPIDLSSNGIPFGAPNQSE